MSEGMEFVAEPHQGRRFSEVFTVRLGDVNAAGTLRLDGVARYLQDIATDDWSDTGVISDDVWVVRRTTLRLSESGRWPRYLEPMTLTTWCGGVGAAWAERRTNIRVDGELLVEASALWVPTGPDGGPRRLREDFFAVYGDAIQNRKVSGRVTTPEIPDSADRRPWPLRRADIDIVGHVNNAALWEALSEVLDDDVRKVSVIHHGSIEWGDVVTLALDESRLWLSVDGVVRVSASYQR